MKHQLTLGDAARIDIIKPVKVYWNFTRRCYSVKQDGIVVAHLTRLGLWEPVFSVSEAGRQRVLAERVKNVHATVTGIYVHLLEDDWTSLPRYVDDIHYNPYRDESFVDQHGNKVESAYWLLLETTDAGRPKMTASRPRK